MDYIYLQGADAVRRASGQMQSASEEMRQSASTIEGSLTDHQRFLTEWLDGLK